MPPLCNPTRSPKIPLVLFPKIQDGCRKHQFLAVKPFLAYMKYTGVYESHVAYCSTIHFFANHGVKNPMEHLFLQIYLLRESKMATNENLRKSTYF